ncbi:MAG: hypothetical protein QM679_03425 [Patulibacter sp.]
MSSGVDAVSASWSSEWQQVSSKWKYWQNTNGAIESSERSNIVVKPHKHYEADSIATESRARVKVKGDKREFVINAAV